MIRSHVLICGGTGCTSSGSVQIQKAFKENIEAEREVGVELDQDELRKYLDVVLKEVKKEERSSSPNQQHRIHMKHAFTTK